MSDVRCLLFIKAENISIAQRPELNMLSVPPLITTHLKLGGNVYLATNPIKSLPDLLIMQIHANSLSFIKAEFIMIVLDPSLKKNGAPSQQFIPPANGDTAIKETVHQNQPSDTLNITIGASSPSDIEANYTLTVLSPANAPGAALNRPLRKNGGIVFPEISHVQ